MTARNGIVCVEWSGPADPLALSERYWNSSRRADDLGPPCAYVVALDGGPLYVGSTWTGLFFRMSKHERASASPLCPFFQRARAGGPPLSVRWIEMPRGRCFPLKLEGQLHRIFQAPLNSIDPKWRNVPLLPERRAA